jgi:membrane protease YdiL (CAAX protease family)
MASGSIATSARESARAVAPWWHTLLVLLVLAAGSLASLLQDGLPNAHLPGLNTRLSSYLTVIGEEWLLAWLIWLALRRRLLAVDCLALGSWRTFGAFARDLGIAAGFTVLAVLLTNLLMVYIGAEVAVIGQIVPHSGLELAAWFAMAASASFCEELTFRGYLLHQFSAWTGSRIAGIAMQGIMFGLSHGFYHRGMLVIMVHGCLLGALAQWRRSLRPGMLAHMLQDGLGGILGLLSR